MSDPEQMLFYSPQQQVGISNPDEHNSTKDEDRQVYDCDENPEVCGINLPGASYHSVVTQPESVEKSLAILEERENDREATLTHLESHGDDVFDSVVLSAIGTGPVLRTTVLVYRHGHCVLFGLTEDCVLGYDLKTETVSEYQLFNVDCNLERHITETLDCVHR